MVETLAKHPQFDGTNAKYLELRQRLVNECFPQLDELKVALATKPMPRKNGLSQQDPSLPQIGLTDAPQVNWSNSGAPNRDPLPPRPSDRLPQTVMVYQGPPGSSMQTSGPPQFETKTSLKRPSGQTMEKHSLFASSVPENRPSVSKTNNSFPKHPAAVSFPSIQPPTESLIDRPQTVPIVKEIPLGPQEIEVQSVSGVPSGDGDQTCACTPPMIPPDVISATQPIMEPELEQKEGLRNVQISRALLDAFLNLAKSNTKREIETCGILAGRLNPKTRSLEVTSLMIPRQKGTRDQVEMVDEEVLLEEVLTNGLMVLGWIHTHPVFQCFLSSIDVHTTLPYQLLLDEAVAIVMAPTDRKRKCGVFRLTDPGGMELIKNCPKRGFHEHKATHTKQSIYEVVSHVYLNERLAVSVKDLR